MTFLARQPHRAAGMRCALPGWCSARDNGVQLAAHTALYVLLLQEHSCAGDTRLAL
jgi:hypothetical protein